MIIYTKTGCPWCNEALAFLKSVGVPFEEREVLSNPKFFEEMRAKSGQSKAPTLDIDGEILPDTDAKAIEIYLRAKEIIK
ncbi:MAG: glutaredoxin [Candidatus Paceibacterota bacterium]